ncbi:glycosyltransferase family 2 protein [Paenibacillus sp. GCM10012307]|uniref:Glycosyltransferase family 2 protein n=1 Tax=Paenibacillus roseus TaxID=2798579 RepID=A0A934IVK4_9BACL|nr:glycosyltransferase family 2 protein [Paenibacillus roseus]MBJ6360092.1 glycosyltransferase family 2 protein [Paenibacillus roseus]
MPKITALISTYNSSGYIQAAVQSILDQTFKDFELIIIDDGSTDDTLVKLGQFTDPRIRLVIHEQNQGLIRSLNEGIELATGEYIARMDADDIAVLDRFEHQVAFLDANPQVGVLGGLMKWLHNNEPIPKPITHHGIRCWQLFHTCLCHPTIMMRTRVLHDHAIRYDEQYPHAEDYELWDRLGHITQLANLPQYVHYYRAHVGQVSIQHAILQEQSAKKVHYNQLRSIGITPTDEEYAIHMQLAHFKVPIYNSEAYYKAIDWVSKLIVSNHYAQIYDGKQLESVLNRCLIYSGKIPEGVYESD